MIPAILLIITGCAQDDPVVPEGEVEREVFWQECDVPLSWNRVKSIDIDDDGMLYVLTDNQDGFSRTSVQLYLSGDGGNTWQFCDIPDVENSESVKVDHQGKVYLLSDDHQEGDCIYLSTDDCESWQRTDIGFNLSDSIGYDMLFDSQNSGFLVSMSGIHRTTDCGYNWEKVLEHKVVSLAIGPGDLLMAAVDTLLYVSESSGDRWSSVAIPLEAGDIIDQVIIDSASRIYVTVIKPAKEMVELLRTDDSGANWEITECWKWRAGWDVDILSASDNTIFLSLYDWLFRSTDCGHNWTKINSGYEYCNDWGCYDDFRAYLIMTCGENGEVAVADERGIYRSLDNGQSWVSIGMPRYYTSDFKIDSNDRMWISYPHSGVYFSDDSFSTFSQFNKGLYNLWPVCLALTEGQSILAGTWDGIYRSSTGWPQWELIGLKSHRIDEVCVVNETNIIAYAVCYQYYTSCRSGVYGTSDGGANWDYLGMEGYTVTCMESDIEKRIYAGTEYGGVFRYTGEDVVWDQLNQGLSSLQIYDLGISSSGNVLACTEGGVYRLVGDGTSWENWGLGGIRVSAIEVTSNGDIYVSGQYWVYRKGENCPDWEILGRNSLPRYVKSFFMDSEGYLFACGNYEVLWRSIQPQN